MDYIMLTAITFFVVGFIVAALLFGALLRRNEPEHPKQQEDLQGVLQEQLRMQMTQNMIRNTQLEQARQEQELLLLAKQRSDNLRLNAYDIRKQAEQIAHTNEGYEV